MDKNILQYIVGETNVLQTNVIISRETTSRGMQYIHVTAGDEVLYEFWHNPNNVPKDKKPKHSGGKKPYLMLMVEQVEELRKSGVKNVPELIGYLVCLGKYVEWSTGRLIQARSKKSLQYKHLQQIFTCSNKTLNKILADLKEYDLLFHTTEGYFISPKLIKKGAAMFWFLIFRYIIRIVPKLI